MFPTRVHPNSKTAFLGYFLLPATRFFFQPVNPDIKKKLELLLHSNISNYDNTKLKSGACNVQISSLNIQLLPGSASVRVLLTDYRTFVVGPFVTSFNWPI